MVPGFTALFSGVGAGLLHRPYVIIGANNRYQINPVLASEHFQASRTNESGTKSMPTPNQYCTCQIDANTEPKFTCQIGANTEPISHAKSVPIPNEN